MKKQNSARNVRMMTAVATSVIMAFMPLATHGQDAGNSVTIKRDGYGIPHVYAETTYGLFYGYGYALAEDRLFQMEMVKRSVLGTASEVLGEEHVNLDISSRSRFDPTSIRAQIEALSEDDRNIFEGYADGFNARIAEVLAAPETLMPKQFIDFDFEPSAWTGFDVAMLYVGTMAGRYSHSSSELSNLRLLQQLQEAHGDDLAAILFDQILWLEDPLAPTTVPRTGDQLSTLNLATLRNHMQKLAPLAGEEAVASVMEPVTADTWPTASNLWILGPDRTTDESTILLNGPQFGNFNPAYVYSIGLHGAGFDLTGNTPFALPVILFGTNGTISWGATAGPLDVNDYYQLILNPDDPHSYLFDDVYRPMEHRSETIAVRDGEDVVIDVYSSVHGVVTDFDIENDTAYAFKRSWDGYEIQSLLGWIHSTRAQNYVEWLEQAERVATTINWYFADSSGNIGYVSPGYLPVRPDNQDVRLPAIGDGSMEWQGFRPFSDVPKTYNPNQGYVVNWNNRSAPGEVATREGGGWSIADRVVELSARIDLEERHSAEAVWDLNEIASYADVNARYFLPYISEAAEGLADDDELRAIVDQLANWDMLAVPGEGGMFSDPSVTIFRAWLAAMIDKVIADDSPVVNLSPNLIRVATGPQLLYNALLGEDSGVPQNYDFFNGASAGEKQELIIETLRETVASLARTHGSDDIGSWLSPYGPHVFSTRNFLGVQQASGDEELRLPSAMNRGTQNNIVIFSDDGVSLCTVAPPGQSGFIAPDGTKSPHYDDQLELYGEFGCNPQWLTPEQVDANAVSTQTLTW